MGVISTKKSLLQLEKLSTASFCRRRLAVVMVRLKMAETMREAVTFIEQVRPNCCTSALTQGVGIALGLLQYPYITR